MSNNYLQPVNNHFVLNGDDLEDIDDDIFLNNAQNKPASRYGSATAGSTTTSTNPFESPQQMYAQKRREIEQRTLESTQKSLGLLYETQDVGQATAMELAVQRKQLEDTSKRLDEINSTLRFSQRHLDGLKSVFGAFKNYLSGSGRDGGAQGSPQPSGVTSPSGNSQMSQAPTASTVSARPAMSPTESYDNHPVSRLRDDNSVRLQQQQKQQQQMQRNNPFETQLQSNLEEMCDNITRLKCLATDLGSEIDTQNDLIDNMNYKIENVDIKIGKQNKEMNRLLGKK